MLRYLKCLWFTSTGWALASTEENVLVGGQAVIEGVLMRSPNGYSVAVRRPDGSLGTLTRPLPPPGRRWRIFRAPLIRGVGVLGQALVLGIRALKFSAEEALEEEAKGSRTRSEESPRGQGLFIAGNLVVAIGVNLLLFIGLPLVATRLLQTSIGFDNFFIFNAVDGLLRLLIFLAFIYAVSRMEDMRRVFAYHGAEHKTVFTFEAREDLSVENARKHSTLHPRCGTSFLLVVVGVSIIVFSLFHFDSFMAKLASRVILMPLVAGISYEVIRYSARHPESLARWVARPGLMLQKVTTNEPDGSQLEVAITALENALAVETPTAARNTATP